MSLLQRGSNRDDGYGLVRRLEERQAPPRRSTSLAQMMQAPLKRAGDQYFSPAASTEQRLVYLFTLIVFGVITCIVLISDLITPPCDEALIDAIIPLHDKPFVNPHYNPGCSAVRYLALLGLTPRECDLGRRILFAMCCGGAVGYERRRGDRPAGIRTMALVSLGSCIFTITSILAFEDGPMSWDSSRVAAAIPSGVGFLGAGLIWRATVRQGDTEQQHVHGLTTAASTWVSASIGVAAGGAMYFVATFSVLTLLFVLRFGPRNTDSVEASSSEADLVEMGRRHAEAPAPAPGVGSTRSAREPSTSPPPESRATYHS